VLLDNGNTGNCLTKARRQFNFSVATVRKAQQYWRLGTVFDELVPGRFWGYIRGAIEAKAAVLVEGETASI
jgi:hypothetical protein